MTDDTLAQTIDVERSPLAANLDETRAAAHSLGVSRVQIGSQNQNDDRLNKQFDESTRQLLLSRLSIAATILATIISLAQVLIWLSGTQSLNTVLVRFSAIASLVGVVVLMRIKPSLPLRHLRWFELLIVFAPIMEVLFVQYDEIPRLIESGKAYQAPTLIGGLGGVICFFVATYAMFIPSNWRRAAAIGLVAAALPTILTAVQYAWLGGLQDIDYPYFGTPFLLFATAGAATLAAHFVRSIRQEVESARQYGQYHLTTEIGRGGMGVVYRAEHRMLKRPAAIKLIRADRSSDDSAIASFEREVQLSATLSHWNTVQIYDYGRTADGDFFYVMEYLEGQTLADRLKSDGPMRPEAGISIVEQLCDGLAEAHAKSLVHRDLKPANIFLAHCGSQHDIVKILDFGLAINQSDSRQQQSMSGSPAYMSPEQVRVERVDGRSDIYAVGCILYECLTGQTLFTGNSITEVFNQHLNKTPVIESNSNVPRNLASVIERCVAKSPTERFPDVASLRAALENWA
ncbi:MAG: serine/threonine-protein kinase [Pirellulaceae bacterium]